MKQQAKILALDTATKCGYAYWTGTRFEGGVWDFSPKKDESRGVRLLRFKNQLDELFSKHYKFDVIAYETPRGRPGRYDALVVQSMLLGVVLGWAEHNGISYVGYTPTEIKRFATGNGNASKELMMQAAQTRLGIVPVDDNHADAMWILTFANSKLNPS